MVRSEQNLIYGIIYTKFDEKIGPLPYSWQPPTISEEIRLQTCMKSISLLAGEDTLIPKSLAIVPFPSFNLKGMIKYIEWDDPTLRGGKALAAIIMLFNEVDDIIFYRYIEDFEGIFGEIATKFNRLTKLDEEKKKIKTEIRVLCEKIQGTLKELREQELGLQQPEAFPDEEPVFDEKAEFVFKSIICGDPAVGKTSTIIKFTDNAFRRTYLPTIGVNVSKKKIQVENSHEAQFIIWDIAGQSKFDLMRKHFYEGADCYILVFDLTNRETFDNISGWCFDIKKYLGENPNLLGLLLGNKNDLVDQREVSKEEAIKLARELNLTYLETSALTGDNIERAFYILGKTLITKREEILYR